MMFCPTRWSLKYSKRLTYLKLFSTPQRHPHCGETSLLNPYSNLKFWLLHLKAGSSTASFKPRDGLAQMMTQNSSFHFTTHMLPSQVSNLSHYSLKIISHPFLPFTGPKVLIAGGWDGNTFLKDTEVLDITNGKTIKLPDLPRGKSGVTGGMLGGIPLICGGYDGQVHNECHQMAQNNISTFNSHLKSKRAGAATTTKVPSKSLWVTGGINRSDGYLKSTEVIQRDGTIVAGPDLPVAVNGHTITATKEDEQYMLIGGDLAWQAQKSTYYHYNTSNGPWLEGPDLKEARIGHTAGLIFDKVNHTQYTVVVGGYNESHALRSVEILKEGSNEWTQGKSSNSFCYCVF